MAEKELCVKWSNHHGTLVAVLESLLSNEMYVDCTLSADGFEIGVHKVVVSACSPYLNKLLQKHYDKHPIIILKDVTQLDLQNIINYIYKGEATVQHEQLGSFLKTAESLEIAGLCGMSARDEILVEKSDQDNDAEDLKMLIEEVRAVEQNKKRKLSVDTVEAEEVKNIGDEDPVVKPIKIEYLSEEGSEQEDYEDYRVYVVGSDGVEMGTVSGELFDKDDTVETTEISADLTDMHEYFKEDNTPEEEEEDDTKNLKRVLKKGKFLPDRKTFKTRQKLKPRSVLHRGDYNISCSKCLGVYKHESTYLNHLRHDCNQIHRCDDCCKSFKNKRHLLDHVRDDCGRIHSCPNCSKCFKQRVNLTTHMKNYCRQERAMRQGLMSKEEAEEKFSIPIETIE